MARLIARLGHRPEIEVDRRSQLLLACGAVSASDPVCAGGKRAIAASRDALKARCLIVADVPVVAAALDQPRLNYLGCETLTLIDGLSPITTSRAPSQLGAEFYLASSR